LVNTSFDTIPKALATSTHSSIRTGWKKVSRILIKIFSSEEHGSGDDLARRAPRGRFLFLDLTHGNDRPDLFLCRLWLTHNFPSIENTIKAIKSVHQENGLPDPFFGPMGWVVKRLIRAFKENVTQAGQATQAPDNDRDSPNDSRKQRL
jgi:hypothetical protein